MLLCLGSLNLPQPAALRGRANQAPTYLPAHQNDKIVHQKYREARTKANEPFMQYRSVLDVWHACVPHIIFMTPRTDVCQKCEDFRIAIQRAVSEDDKKGSFQTSTHIWKFHKRSVTTTWLRSRRPRKLLKLPARITLYLPLPTSRSTLCSKFSFLTILVRWALSITKFL